MGLCEEETPALALGRGGAGGAEKEAAAAAAEGWGGEGGEEVTGTHREEGGERCAY